MLFPTRLLALCLLFPAAAAAHDVATEMSRAADKFLQSLDAEQRKIAVFSFADAERKDWHFVPRERRGLPLKQMKPAQRELAHALLATALSERGHTTARTIISLENVLAEIENNPTRRDPEKYYFTIFGAPDARAPWGWRCEGHHLAVNVTVAGANVVITTPHFFGANPAQVRSGPHAGLRTLGADEDLGRAFVKSLSAEQRKAAIIQSDAPDDIFNVPGRTDSKPEGIAWPQLDAAQRDALLKLVRHYIERFRPELSGDAMRELAHIGVDGLHFAWAGSLEPGERHYYRIQTAGFVIEYDNTQNGANHVHTVWREFGREFGRDALAEHHRVAHGQ
jgi:hypothetical protein